MERGRGGWEREEHSPLLLFVEREGLLGGGAMEREGGGWEREERNEDGTLTPTLSDILG